MKAQCPNKNKPDHDNIGLFRTTAHVVQEWFVDEEGNFDEVVSDCLEVSHKPDVGNIWNCVECGAEATFTE